MTAVPGTPEERWRTLLPVLGLRPAGAPVPVTSHSNDTWLVDDERQGAVVLRVGWRGDVTRLLREAALGAALPVEAGYPAVLGSGALPAAGLTWTVTRRLPGCSLGDAWPGLSPREREAAVAATARMLTALHAFRPAPTLAGLLLPAPLPPVPDVGAVVGRSMLPWPDGVEVLLDAAAGAGAPSGLVAGAARLLRRDAHLGPDLDVGAVGVVHGDLHLQNVWCDGRRVTALLDLEWVRRAPPWVELVQLVDEVDQDVFEGRTGHAELLAGLRRHTPSLFAVDRLPERLRLLRVAYQLRQLAVWPAADAATAPSDHPVRRLAELVGEDR